ncbi:hypothetical protein AAID30_004492 [Escherichia coli]
MNYQTVSELITSSNHNVLIVWDSASEVDGFLNKLNITDYKYYDFSQIYSCSDRTLNDYAVIFIRDALNASEHIIIFNCVGWPDLGGGSAVSQFAMMARKFGKQLIVAVSEKDAIKLKDNFNIIGTLSYGKENFIAMSHTKSEFCS